MSNAREPDQKGFREEAAGLSWPGADPPGVFSESGGIVLSRQASESPGMETTAMDSVWGGGDPPDRASCFGRTPACGAGGFHARGSALPAAARRPLPGILTSWREGNDRGPGSRPPSLRYNFPRHVFPGDNYTPSLSSGLQSPTCLASPTRDSAGAQSQRGVGWWPLALTIALSHERLTSSMRLPRPLSVSQGIYLAPLRTGTCRGQLPWAGVARTQESRLRCPAPAPGRPASWGQPQG